MKAGGKQFPESGFIKFGSKFFAGLESAPQVFKDKKLKVLVQIHYV
jgi:hypothetical protein